MLLLNKLVSSSLISPRSTTALQQLRKQLKSVTPIINQQCVKQNDVAEKSKKDDLLDVDIVDKKLGLIARFKKMTKEYWYVLIPVHCFTSCFWFGGFYYASLW